MERNRGGKKEAYVVFIGHQPGIYKNWSGPAGCSSQLSNSQGVKIRGYYTLEEAERAWAKWQTSMCMKEASVPVADRLDSITTPQKHQREHTLPVIVPEPEDVTSIPRKKRRTKLMYPSVIVDYESSSDEEVDDDYKYAFYPDPRNEQDETPPVFEHVDLTAEQEAVAKAVLDRHNVFLTGAAGTGKSITVQQILMRLKKLGKEFQVIAPTAFAALPYKGKTVHAMAGWKIESLWLPLEDLRKAVLKMKFVLKNMLRIDFLVIEEISMLENQVLERLDLVMREALDLNRPFGGKQLCILGDFYQLPPVRPFERCLECGKTMIPSLDERERRRKNKIDDEDRIRCINSDCFAVFTRQSFAPGDMWAFKAPVFKKLKLKYFELKQIHRQEDPYLQNILNKLGRTGEQLSMGERTDIERVKTVPPCAYATRLMATRNQVDTFNGAEMAKLKTSIRKYNGRTDCQKAWLTEKDRNCPAAVRERCEEWKTTLAEHRFPEELFLRVGAKVVLRSNISPKRGLVNGSQGEITGFYPPARQYQLVVTGDQKRWRTTLLASFQEENPFGWPIVKFGNGIEQPIPPVAECSPRGNPQDLFFVCRTQIPLTLGWALSIHQSQGMSLDHLYVSAQYIWLPGQFYTAVSRARKLEGLTVADFNGRQIPLDEAVAAWYRDVPWEHLKQKPAPKPIGLKTRNLLEELKHWPSSSDEGTDTA